MRHDVGKAADDAGLNGGGKDGRHYQAAFDVAYESVYARAVRGERGEVSLSSHLRGKLRFNLFVVVQRGFYFFKPRKEPRESGLVRLSDNAKLHHAGADRFKLLKRAFGARQSVENAFLLSLKRRHGCGLRHGKGTFTDVLVCHV